MSSNRCRREQEYTDALTTFFQDVAQIPIVAGRDEYLPLTRRIKRGTVLDHLRGAQPEHTLEKVSNALRQTLGRLDGLFTELGLDLPDWNQVSIEIEPFLDEPGQDCPPSLDKTIGKLKRCAGETAGRAEDLVWRYFYLLSLLPSSQRARSSDVVFGSEIAHHFEQVHLEAEQAKQTLVEGTLRYVISIARTFLGQGVPYLDLVQEGFIGLIRATQSYDEHLGHFQSYASQWIRQRIGRFITDSNSTIRVPVHIQEKNAQIAAAWSDYEKTNGQSPTESELFEILQQISLNATQEDSYDTELEEETSQHHKISSSEEETRAQRHKARNRLSYYRMVNVPPYTLDGAELHSAELDDDIDTIELAQHLVDETTSEETADLETMQGSLTSFLSRILKEKELDIIKMRFGLIDGEERTLEEVGQHFGVTRERIRQIEAKAFTKIKYKSLVNEFGELYLFLRTDHRPNVISIADQQYRRLMKAITWHEETHPIEETEGVSEEIAHIEELMRQYITRGRPGRASDTRRFGSRSALLENILETLGSPTHYTVLHEEAMNQLPEALQFPKERAYSTMFYSDKFRLYGNGVFGLASWDTTTLSASGETVFQHCPIPLLPVTTYPSAFFDSVMLGRDLLSRRKLTVEQYWHEMQSWARHNGTAVQEAQDAFDAWYAAGLIDHVDFIWQKDAPLSLTISQDAGLSQVREYCLSALCRRIAKMPELLLALVKIARPNTALLQKALYGSERAGFDVPVRLSLLASFGAVQRIGDEWRLTEIGHALLRAHPPQDLPDFGEADAILAEPTSGLDWGWEYDDLGLLDF